MNLTDSHLIALAEDSGFKRCFPNKAFGDNSPRWQKGGGNWEERDVINFIKQKTALDTSLRLKAAGFLK